MLAWNHFGWVSLKGITIAPRLINAAGLIPVPRKSVIASQPAIRLKALNVGSFVIHKRGVMTAVAVDHQIITVFWSSAPEIGLKEPNGAMAVELEDDDYWLIQYLNAVVYATGIWKITEYDRGEGPLIIGGQETDIDAAQKRVEQALHEIWRHDGEID